LNISDSGGRFTVYAQDEKAGYSNFSTRPAIGTKLQEVTLSPDHPEAEFNFRLPPPAGFLRIHLTNRKTVAEISGVKVDLRSPQDPSRSLFYEGCASSHVILIPPDQDLLIHVNSWDYREWDENVGDGKPIRITSGDHVTFEVEVDPSD
jgi:hypothetical protein